MLSPHTQGDSSALRPGLVDFGCSTIKARTDRDTGSVEPGSRPIFGSVSGSENQF